MPYTHRITFSAANGQALALRAVLEATMRTRQAAGYRGALGSVIYGADTPQFDAFFVFDDLAVLETFRADPPPPAYLAQIAVLTARPPQTELLRGIVAPNVGSTPVAYTTRATLFPVVHKLPQLQEALEQNVREEQADGGRVGLGIGHGGPPRLEVNRLYASFAELDRIGPPPNETRAKRVEGLFASPPVTLIRQVLIPLN